MTQFDTRTLLRLPIKQRHFKGRERAIFVLRKAPLVCMHTSAFATKRPHLWADSIFALRLIVNSGLVIHSLSVIRHANAFGSDWTAALFITQVSLVGTLLNNRAKWARQPEGAVCNTQCAAAGEEREKKARAGRTSWCVRAATPVRLPLAAAGVEFYATRCALELAGRFSRLCQHFIRLHTTARQPCEEKLLRFSLIPTQKSTRPMERRRGGVEGGAGAATRATCCPRSPAPWIIVAIMRVMIDTRAGRRTNETTQKGAEFNSKEWSKTGKHFFTRRICTF